MSSNTKECDYLVLGIGSGGIASGRRAAKHGAKVIAIESSRYGGTCVNVGCVPKKVTWNAAAIAETFKDAPAYGFQVGGVPDFDWPYFKKKRDDYVKRLNGIYENNLNKDEIEHFRGRAKFVAKDEVEVALNDGGVQRIKAKHILIATGGRPMIPDIPGKELCINSDGFFDLEKQPKSIATSGAGYIGVEMTGMLHALGTKTHFFIRGDKLLRSFDPMIQDTVTQEYERQGINLYKGTQITKVEDIGHGLKRVTYQETETKRESTVEVEEVLFATGRVPEIEDLKIADFGIKLNEKNHIVTDEYQNTSIPNIYAIGDVCDRGFELTPVAIASGRRLSDRLFNNQPDAHLEYENIPSVVFAHPEIGSIGLTEPEARKKYGDDKIKIYKTQFTAMYFAMMDPSEKQPTAYKIICAGDNEKVVGLHILGQGSSEILQGFGVAIKMGATKKDFDNCVVRGILTFLSCAIVRPLLHMPQFLAYSDDETALSRFKDGDSTGIFILMHIDAY
ncbi:glutathione reductase [Pyrenophora tritici-repentis Pt-1C-BFP]|uniref:Glutathione reductase n=1 Tax=Pyrenophora tritici-repentis (strain Pt-1C-BFP) TaxID=426418 RepID=B2W133_PYRTR|nr:glutathione reductase [Pyrenophora tritici-repentis Pt-1C-BFP]EDU47006.1 glutathione reductase [Pyrenophora tritici-repentis Pt-1C-BFP]